jgi:hypothetical protein
MASSTSSSTDVAPTARAAAAFFLPLPLFFLFFWPFFLASEEQMMGELEITVQGGRWLLTNLGSVDRVDGSPDGIIGGLGNISLDVLKIRALDQIGSAIDGWELVGHYASGQEDKDGGLAPERKSDHLGNERVESMYGK